MLLETFKALHGLKEIVLKKGKGRAFAVNTTIPVIASDKCDFNKELHIVPCTANTGEEVWVICNNSAQAFKTV